MLQYSTRSNEQAMALNIVFRIFEELMDKKYEADQANFLTNRVPNSIPDFFIDHLKRVYGLKILAQKAMSQMMISLKELYDQNHNYGRIICRLLQIYDPQPIPTPLALFITKARHDMNKIIGSKKQGKRQNTLEEIQIIEAINLVYTLFETDKFSRAKGILLLKPKIMNEEEYLLFRICNKIIRMGQTIENIFIMFDEDSQGYLTRGNVIEGVKKILEISLSQQEIEMLNDTIDPKESNCITHDQFLGKLSLKQYLEQTKDQRLTISKSHFLGILIEIYNIVQIRDTAILTSIFKSYKKIKINQLEFLGMIGKIDNKISQDQSFILFKEALLLNDDCSLDGVTSDAFIKVVFKHAIGRRGLRDFRNFYLEMHREEYENIEEKLTPVKVDPDREVFERCKSPVLKPTRKGSFIGLPEKANLPKSRRLSRMSSDLDKPKNLPDSDKGKNNRPATSRGTEERSKSPVFGKRNK